MTDGPGVHSEVAEEQEGGQWGAELHPRHPPVLKSCPKAVLTLLEPEKVEVGTGYGKKNREHQGEVDEAECRTTSFCRLIRLPLSASPPMPPEKPERGHNADKGQEGQDKPQDCDEDAAQEELLPNE